MARPQNEVGPPPTNVFQGVGQPSTTTSGTWTVSPARSRVMVTTTLGEVPGSATLKLPVPAWPASSTVAFRASPIRTSRRALARPVAEMVTLSRPGSVRCTARVTRGLGEQTRTETVGVAVGVTVAVAVDVAVGVWVAVAVGVNVAVGLGSGRPFSTVWTAGYQTCASL